MLSPEQEIKLELESHLADQQEELVHAGMSAEEAKIKALELFGSLDDHVIATLSAHTPARFFFHPTTTIFILSLCTLTVSGLLFVTLAGSTNQLVAEKALVWSGFCSLVGLALCLTRFLIEYFGLKTQAVVYASLVLSLLMSFSITSLLDLNNFEVTIHLMFLALILAMTLHFGWKRIVLPVKYAVLYLFSGLSMFVAFIEHPIFGFIGSFRCLFILPATTPLTGSLAVCQQLPLWHPLLLLLYTLVFGGGVYLLTIFWSYLKNHSTGLYRKVILVASMSSFGLAPMALPDLNKYGEMDIVPWKIEIYSAYEDILGRDPEQKDIEFYARSHAYQDMVRLKEVLYQSDERKLKIDLLYQTILHRQATPQEISDLVQQQMTVEEITVWLETQVP